MTMTTRTRTVRLKVATGGNLRLAHPLAPPGPMRPGVHVVHVDGVPRDVAPERVLLDARHSMTVARAARATEPYHVDWACVEGAGP